MANVHRAATPPFAAVEAFSALGNIAEGARAHWTVAMTRLARGEHESLDSLYDLAAVNSRR